MKENSVRENRLGTAVALVTAPCVAVVVETQLLGVLDPKDSMTHLSAGENAYEL